MTILEASVGAAAGAAMAGWFWFMLGRPISRRRVRQAVAADPRFDWQPTGRWRRSQPVPMGSSGLAIRRVELEEARVTMDSGSPIQQVRWRTLQPGEMYFANPEQEVSWKSEE